MTPIEQIRHELANHVVELLDSYLPRFRALDEHKLGQKIENAAAIGVVRWALMCTERNQSAASRRTGINRNTLYKLMKEGLMLEEEAKYAKALGEINKPRQRIGTY